MSDHTVFMNQPQPNISILVLGHSGAGKSQLINYLLGRSVCRVGEGVAQTTEWNPQHYVPEDPAVNGSITLIDSRGTGEQEALNAAFGDQLKSFLDRVPVDVILVAYNATWKNSSIYEQSLQLIGRALSVTTKNWSKVVFVVTHSATNLPTESAEAFWNRSSVTISYIRNLLNDKKLPVPTKFCFVDTTKYTVDSCGQKLLPDGTAMYPPFLETVASLLDEEKAFYFTQLLSPLVGWKEVSPPAPELIDSSMYFMSKLKKVKQKFVSLFKVDTKSRWLQVFGLIFKRATASIGQSKPLSDVFVSAMLSTRPSSRRSPDDEKRMVVVQQHYQKLMSLISLTVPDSTACENFEKYVGSSIEVAILPYLIPFLVESQVDIPTLWWEQFFSTGFGVKDGKILEINESYLITKADWETVVKPSFGDMNYEILRMLVGFLNQLLDCLKSLSNSTNIFATARPGLCDLFGKKFFNINFYSELNIEDSPSNKKKLWTVGPLCFAFFLDSNNYQLLPQKTKK